MSTGVSLGNQRFLAAAGPERETSRCRQTCSFTWGCVGRDPEQNPNGLSGTQGSELSVQAKICSHAGGGRRCQGKSLERLKYWLVSKKLRFGVQHEAIIRTGLDVSRPSTSPAHPCARAGVCRRHPRKRDRKRQGRHQRWTWTLLHDALMFT